MRYADATWRRTFSLSGRLGLSEGRRAREGLAVAIREFFLGSEIRHASPPSTIAYLIWKFSWYEVTRGLVINIYEYDHRADRRGESLRPVHGKMNSLN